MKARSGTQRTGVSFAVRCFIVLGVALVLALSVHPEFAKADPCPNEVFRTGIGAGLPDCRAYEQVTPVDKNGGYAQGLIANQVAAEIGPGVTFFDVNASTIPGVGSGSTGDFPTFLASRNGDTWTSQNLLTPSGFGPLASFLGITPDMHYSVVQALNTNFGHPDAGRGLYLIDNRATEPSEAVTTIVPPADNEEELYYLDGLSREGSRVIFETRAVLPTNPAGGPTPTPGSDNLYVWDRASGQISVAGVLPLAEGGEAPAGGAFGGSYEWFEQNEPSTGGAIDGMAVEEFHAISPTVDQIYFTAGGTGQIYLRAGLTSPEARTIRISESNAGVSDPQTPTPPAAFQEATPDGSKAFFMSGAKLTEDATTGSTDEGRDLYRFDVQAPTGHKLIDLSPDTNSETPNGAEVQALLGASEDGTSGFFVAKGVLAAGGKAGEENIYSFETSGSKVDLKFATSLGPTATQSVIENWAPQTTKGGVGGASYLIRGSRVNQTGKVLIFTMPVSGAGSAIMRFDARTSSLDCISCSGFGVTGEASSLETGERFSKFFFPEIPARAVFGRNLSGDGDRVFFQTTQSLVPSDSNGSTECMARTPQLESPPCQDVYEWEAARTPGGSCSQAELNGGCLYLLSSGQGNEPSFFDGASKDGNNVYILTTSRLVPSDSDRAADVYDVSVDGGLTSQHQLPTPGCTGEGCLGILTMPPAAQTPSSSQIQGPGNSKPRKKAKHKHKRARHHRHKKGRKNVKNRSKGHHTAGTHAAANRGEN